MQIIQLMRKYLDANISKNFKVHKLSLYARLTFSLRLLFLSVMPS